MVSPGLQEFQDQWVNKVHQEKVESELMELQDHLGPEVIRVFVERTAQLVLLEHANSVRQ